MIPVPNRANIRLFVDALRSGDYQQGISALGYTEAGVDKFCCLGVAIEVAIKCGVPLIRIVGNANGKHGAFIYADEDQGVYGEGKETRGIYLHPKVQEFYGFDSYNPDTHRGPAGDLNDVQRLGFNEIAQAFEDTYLKDPDTETHEDKD